MRPYILSIFSILVFSCAKPKQKSYVFFEKYDTAAATLKDSAALNSSNNKFDGIVYPSITIDSTKYYVVEGDLLLTEYEYLQHQLAALVPVDTSLEKAKLVGILIDNKVVRWPENFVIKYCIAKNSFPTIEQYNAVKANMQQATADWQKTCNVRFAHDEAKDASNILTPAGDLTFVVVGFNANNRFIASAFFPYDPATKRRLLIDPSYFGTNFDKVGVLRHELGHTLGFRHEHIRRDAPVACQGESLTGTINITHYDPKSVMHYFCGGMGNILLKITAIDKQGSREIYGSPK